MRTAVGMAAVALALGVAQAAPAGYTINTVDPSATLGAEGRSATVGVLLGCDRAQRARLRVTISQGAPHTGLAEGRRPVACTTGQRTFPVRATARRRRALRPGAATVCVLATTADDTRQWCREVALG